MARYISKFASTMPGSQRNQVAVLLSEGGEDGTITNFSEFKTALEEYSSLVKNSPRPLFSVVAVQANDLIDSWTYNYLMRMAQLDIDTIYQEVDNFYQKTDVYRRLRGKYVQDIRDAIAALDSAISRQEVLNAQPDYALAQYNTFNMLGVGRLYRNAAEAGTLFYDYRKNESLGSDYDTVVDAQREGLVLPITNKRDAEITSVLVEASETTESQLDVDPEDNDISNLFAKDDGKYWVKGIMLLSTDDIGNTVSPPSDGVTVQLVVEFTGYQDINTLTLVPFTDNSMTISQISYEDVDGDTYALTASAITLVEESVIAFNRVRAKSIILDITQKSYSELADFTYNSQPESVLEIDNMVIGAGLPELAIGTGIGTEYAKGYFYTVGFDYIGASLCDYESRGIYVTTPLTTESRVAQVLLDSTYVKSVDQQNNVQDSVEFTLAKYDYDVDGGLLGVGMFPIKGSTSDTTKEELVVNGTVGVLRFMPEVSTLNIYRDNTLLILGTDYTISNDGLNFGTTVSTATGPPYSFYIKLVSPITSSVYTSSYTPASTINSVTPYSLDKDGTAFFNGSVITFEYLPETEVAYSKLFLVIIMRTLSYSNRETPIVLDYTLYASEK